ncbi:hypothetical protein Lepto782_05170 [Leptospira interrogans serovar Canicola]|uniref:Uncharacterized protein n=1 Tax=Leptospira interrogans serovar Canicola TaxID=211880 RepID=A0AAP9W944_LEPIR|nr:hypothetical protein Lepto782_05050 [Leptospira interrogans serovar Canicola]QOI41721.1 hypothetical protein Lepto782_05170 [Leptospira interrogans serovar Canicola]
MFLIIFCPVVIFFSLFILRSVRSSSNYYKLFYKYFADTLVGDKYLCVVIKNGIDDLFLVTAYFTDKVKEGKVLYG